MAKETPPEWFNRYSGFDGNVSRAASFLREKMEAAPAYKVKRFFIRMARIFCGLCLLLVALYIGGEKKDIADIPMAALTLQMIASSIFAWLGIFAFLYWAFTVAFGAKPTRAEAEEEFRLEAEKMLEPWIDQLVRDRSGEM